MGLFDDLLGQASELTGFGQDAVDSATQAAEDAKAQVEDQVQGATEQLPQDPADIAGQFFGDKNNEK
jgi:hypothetical protein